MRKLIQLVVHIAAALAFAGCGGHRGGPRARAAGQPVEDRASLTRQIDSLNQQLKTLNYNGLDGYLAGFWPSGQGLFTLVPGGTVRAADRPRASRLLNQVKTRAEALARLAEGDHDKNLRLHAYNVIAGATAGLQQLDGEDQADQRANQTKLL